MPAHIYVAVHACFPLGSYSDVTHSGFSSPSFEVTRTQPSVPDGTPQDATPQDGSRPDGARHQMDQMLIDTGRQQSCAASDLDVDGYGTDIASSAFDCNDENELTYPGAMEAFNGQDDDCGGDVDESTHVHFLGNGPRART